MGMQRARRSRGRHAVQLAFLAAALVTLVAPALHSQLSVARNEPGAAVAGTAPQQWKARSATGDSLPHDASTCPQCIAIAQARTLIQAPVVLVATGPAGFLYLVPPRAPQAPAAAPAFARGARAPPQLSLES